MTGGTDGFKMVNMGGFFFLLKDLFEKTFVF